MCIKGSCGGAGHKDLPIAGDRHRRQRQRVEVELLKHGFFLWLMLCVPVSLRKRKRRIYRTSALCNFPAL